MLSLLYQSKKRISIYENHLFNIVCKDKMLKANRKQKVLTILKITRWIEPYYFEEILTSVLGLVRIADVNNLFS